jgi:2-polyprenyl-3-methyl-5-hydroxy-6-metoxy-1,4-benzoquinol methylase
VTRIRRVAKDEEITMTVPLDERLVESATAALELYGVHLGRALGLYAALAGRGPLTPAELADAAGIDERYAREWLEQQAVSAYLVVDEPSPSAAQRRYALPEEHVGALVDADDPAHVAPLADMVAGIGHVIPEVVAAYRTGAGVPYLRYGEDFRRGQGGVNRPAFTHDLTGSWLPAVPDLHEALARPGVRIADLGCGLGFSSIALARAYPDAEVVGIDADPPSIDEARERAREAGVRVQYVAADAAEVGAHGPFDAIVVLEALHDMARPVEALRAAHKSLAEGGCVVVVDERVQAEFTAPGDLLERMMYGWSITHCLPTQRAEEPSAAIGTVLRSSHVAALAEEAGFTRVDEPDVDAGFFRVYRLLP